MSGGFDPLVPREIDRPTIVPLDADVAEGEIAALLDDAKIFAAPSDPAQLERWRGQLTAWREGARERHGIPQRYDDPDAAWASRCFTVAQVWLWDELFFDVDAQRFTPDRFLADAQERFGGLDGVVLWHAYPVIGIDERNQWDFYDVPGLPEAAAALHDAGVRVFVDYNPWDTGTRRGGDDVGELAEVIRRLGADGVFLDTLKNADPDFVAALDRARPGIGLEGESKLATERIGDHSLSWAQWFADTHAARRAARAPLRAAAHAAPHPALAPRPLRRADLGLAQRRRGDGLGGRLRRVGRLERPRRRDPPPHAAGAAAAAPLARRRRVDAARGVRAVRPGRIDVRARGHDPRACWRTPPTPISRIGPRAPGGGSRCTTHADAAPSAPRCRRSRCPPVVSPPR